MSLRGWQAEDRSPLLSHDLPFKLVGVGEFLIIEVGNTAVPVASLHDEEWRCGNIVHFVFVLEFVGWFHVDASGLLPLVAVRPMLSEPPPAIIPEAEGP